VSASLRFAWLIALLGGAVAGQQWLSRHLEAAGPLPSVPLRGPLSSLPLELGPWRGVDMPIEDERYLYADEHLQRTYYDADRGKAVSIWIAYSTEGADRRHHPEVCMDVAGKPEDAGVRQSLDVPGPGDLVQQFRFGTPGHWQWVFYWHYTLRPDDDKQPSDALQRVYQRMRKLPSSMTVEVFAPEHDEDDVEAARDFVRRLAVETQLLAGPDAERGSERLPVTVIHDAPPPEVDGG
jgi:hypothetical protein